MNKCMKHRYTILLLAATLALSACGSEKVEVLKSPCAGIDGSPCGPKRPMNGPLNPHSQHKPDQA